MLTEIMLCSFVTGFGGILKTTEENEYDPEAGLLALTRQVIERFGDLVKNEACSLIRIHTVLVHEQST